MLHSDFDACLRFVLAREGGFSNHASDPGGATQAGVTLATFRQWVDDPAATVDQLRAITDAQLAALYSVNYWMPLHCDMLPRGVSLMCFDFGVNAGVRRSAILLQQAVGATADGWVGPATLAAVQRVPVLELIGVLATMQDHHYRSCTAFPTFGRGWLSRLAQRKATALSAARGSQSPQRNPKDLRGVKASLSSV